MAITTPTAQKIIALLCCSENSQSHSYSGILLFSRIDVIEIQGQALKRTCESCDGFMLFAQLDCTFISFIELYGMCNVCTAIYVVIVIVCAHRVYICLYIRSFYHLNNFLCGIIIN